MCISLLSPVLMLTEIENCRKSCSYFMNEVRLSSILPSILHTLYRAVHALLFHVYHFHRIIIMIMSWTLHYKDLPSLSLHTGPRPGHSLLLASDRFLPARTLQYRFITCLQVQSMHITTILSFSSKTLLGPSLVHTIWQTYPTHSPFDSFPVLCNTIELELTAGPGHG